jgi:hypothetical protein
MKSAAGTMSKAAPNVYGPAESASCQPENALARPPATINGPRRLAGRRHHAITPAVT